MGFRSGLKGGGGWFSGDGTLRPFTFSAIAPGDTKPGKWAYLVLAFQQDGSEKVNTRRMFLGSSTEYIFEEGGDTAQQVTKDGEAVKKTRIGKKLEAGRFFTTLVESGDKAGIDFDTILPDLDKGEPLNFDAINGLRVNLGSEPDVKGTSTQGQVVGSDGVARDRTFVIVDAVYGLPATTAAAKGVSKSASRTNGSGKANTAVRDAADTIVTAMLNGGELPVSKIQAKAKMTVLRSDIDKGIKDAVSKMLGDAAYFADAAERGIFVYDGEAETVAVA